MMVACPLSTACADICTWGARGQQQPVEDAELLCRGHEGWAAGHCPSDGVARVVELVNESQSIFKWC